MAITRALSGEERFERLVDETTSSLLVEAAARGRDVTTRLMPIKHAIEVNRKRNEWHGFGQTVVHKIVANAMSDYFMRSSMGAPNMEDAGDETHTRHMPAEKVKVLRAVMEAVGMEETQEEGVFPGVTIGPKLIVPERWHNPAAPDLYSVTFDQNQPGVAYVEHATSVITWDPQATLRI